MANAALRQLLKRYRCVTAEDYVNSLKEVLQEIALLGLWRAKFFEHAAFYGGTALRILYDLNRFSEDLDFSLLEPSTSFSWGRYERAITTELAAFGIQASVQEKIKTNRSAIQSAFLKADTVEHLLQTDISATERRRIHLGQQVKIRIELDTQPPGAFATEEHYLLQPIPFAVRAYAPPDLFAGKMHALLCRTWKNRVKGRDWWDFVWFVGQDTQLNLAHLEERMRQTGHYTLTTPMTEVFFRQLLAKKIDVLDVVLAKSDIRPFIADASQLDIWSAHFFHAVARKVSLSRTL